MPPARRELIERRRGTPLRVWLRAYQRTLLQLFAAVGVVGFIILLAAQIELGRPPPSASDSTAIPSTDAVSAPPPTVAPIPPTPTALLQPGSASTSVNCCKPVPDYRADILGLQVDGGLVRVAFRATGADDLVDPGGACLVPTHWDLGGYWPVGTELSADTPGHIEGTVLFEIPRDPGVYEFRYNCVWGDYSSVTLFSL